MSDKFAVIVVVLLLILTALGNALAMFLVALVLLVSGFFIFRKQSIARGGILAATVGCVVAIVVALIWLFR
jgi:hypothetical protein